uniref:DUF916 domain-containing protein n=1 Tax=candidate division CPR3 bacterium TaxID=2268181 RepID=A0A7C4M074_UNCC3
MKNKKITYFFLTLLFVFCFIGFPAKTLALEDDMQNRGFSLSPGSVDDVLSPGQTKEYEIVIKNNNSQESSFAIEIEDFEFSSDPKLNGHLLGKNKSKYSLRDYMKIEPEEINIKAGETSSLKVSVSLPSGISLPGLYSAVLIKQKNNIFEEGVTRIIPRIGVFFYIAVDGVFSGGNQSLGFKYKSFSKACFDSGCVDSDEKYNVLEISLKNEKNTHLSLYGTIEISNMVGKKIALLPINSWLVAPNSEKIKEIKWKNPPRLIGLYKAKVVLNNNHDSGIIEKSFYFWSLPWQLIFILIAAAFLIIFLPISKNKLKKIVDKKNKK